MHKSKLLKIAFRLTPTVVLAGILLGCACGDTKKPVGGVLIVKQPQGGQLIQTVSCELELASDASDTNCVNPQVVYTAIWMSDKDEHKRESFTVVASRGEKRTQNHTTTFSAPQGLYLDRTFWLEVHWDDRNGFQILKSAKAVCIVP